MDSDDFASHDSLFGDFETYNDPSDDAARSHGSPDDLMSEPDQFEPFEVDMVEPEQLDELMSEPDQLDEFMSEPDQQEPEVISLSLPQFVSLGQDLNDSNTMGAFTRFMLTGIHDDVQYQVDPIKDTLREDHNIQALRDYDSMLGIHKHICVNAYLTVYPVSKFEDTLRHNIHIKYSFSNANVRTKLWVTLLFLTLFYRENSTTFRFIASQTSASQNGELTILFASYFLGYTKTAALHPLSKKNISLRSTRKASVQLLKILLRTLPLNGHLAIPRRCFEPEARTARCLFRRRRFQTGL